MHEKRVTRAYHRELFGATGLVGVVRRLAGK